MKVLAVALCIILSASGFAQTDTIKAGVYGWNTTSPDKGDRYNKKRLISGSSSNLASMEVYTLTIGPGQDPPPAYVLNDYEELIIVKEGSLTVTIKNNNKVLEAGGIALALAGDKHGFSNSSNQPVTYYILKLKSTSPVNINRGISGSFMKNWSELVKVNTEKGESRAIFDQPSSMFAKFDAHATALNPGIASHPPHTHAAEEIILVIEGDVAEQINQSSYNATAGDVIYLASNVLHNVKNIGKEQCGYFAIQWRN